MDEQNKTEIVKREDLEVVTAEEVDLSTKRLDSIQAYANKTLSQILKNENSGHTIGEIREIVTGPAKNFLKENRANVMETSMLDTLASFELTVSSAVKKMEGLTDEMEKLNVHESQVPIVGKYITKYRFGKVSVGKKINACKSIITNGVKTIDDDRAMLEVIRTGIEEKEDEGWKQLEDHKAAIVFYEELDKKIDARFEEIEKEGLFTNAQIDNAKKEISRNCKKSLLSLKETFVHNAQRYAERKVNRINSVALSEQMELGIDIAVPAMFNGIEGVLTGVVLRRGIEDYEHMQEGANKVLEQAGQLTLENTKKINQKVNETVTNIKSIMKAATDIQKAVQITLDEENKWKTMLDKNIGDLTRISEGVEDSIGKMKMRETLIQEGESLIIKGPQKEEAPKFLGDGESHSESELPF